MSCCLIIIKPNKCKKIYLLWNRFKGWNIRVRSDWWNHDENKEKVINRRPPWTRKCWQCHRLGMLWVIKDLGCEVSRVEFKSQGNLASKVLERILTNTIKCGTDKMLRPEQAGFREGKNTNRTYLHLDKYNWIIYWVAGTSAHKCHWFWESFWFDLPRQDVGGNEAVWNLPA